MKEEHISIDQLQPDSVGRKAPQWTREKISQLIELYKKHECLWNHWHESYKCKVKRNRAIEDICFTLRITKFDFGRKIHNLRNQFNTEMKKLEQRVGEAGESVDEPSTALRCKWIHFESLMFLRNVIEPRPGGYQSTYQTPKKMRLRFDYNSAEDDVNVTMLPSNTNSSSGSAQHNEEITQYQQYEEDDIDGAATEEFHNFKVTDVDHRTTREDAYNQKYQPTSPAQQNPPAITTLNSGIASNPRCFIQPVNNQKISQTSQTHNSISHAPTQLSRKSSSHTEVVNITTEDSSIIEHNTNNGTVISTPSAASDTTTPSNNLCSSIAASCNRPFVSAVNASTTVTTMNKPSMTLPVIRDQWDAFGELVATEFRNLNSDISRKKLKRKIMQAMLEVGEDDDAL